MSDAERKLETILEVLRAVAVLGARLESVRAETARWQVRAESAEGAVLDAWAALPPGFREMLEDDPRGGEIGLGRFVAAAGALFRPLPQRRVIEDMVDILDARVWKGGAEAGSIVGQALDILAGLDEAGYAIVERRTLDEALDDTAPDDTAVRT